jgi:hypothetical protein
MRWIDSVIDAVRHGRYRFDPAQRVYDLFVEGDVADCFGSPDHDVMVGILAEKIHDNRFLSGEFGTEAMSPSRSLTPQPLQTRDERPGRHRFKGLGEQPQRGRALSTGTARLSQNSLGHGVLTTASSAVSLLRWSGSGSGDLTH